MSTLDKEEIFNIGRRLRDERTRLGLSQEAFGTKVGTTGRTIKKYEGNETSPRANELLVAWGFGLDVLYVITGQRTPLSLHEERAAYSPAERLAEEIRELTLSESDARLMGDLVKRLASNGR